MLQTKLIRVVTDHCSYPMLHMDWGDGKPIVLPQQWVDSPPRIKSVFFDISHIPFKAYR